MALPKYVLRDCHLYVSGVSLLGQLEELTLPVPEVKTEEMRNAGMVMPIECHMGYEKLEMSFKLPTTDPRIIAQFGLRPGLILPYMATGALLDDDGSTHSAVAYMTGFMKKADIGNWKPGEKNDATFEVSCRDYRLLVDGLPILSVTPFEVSIAGISQTDGVRAALLA